MADTGDNSQDGSSKPTSPPRPLQLVTLSKKGLVIYRFDQQAAYEAAKKIAPQPPSAGTALTEEKNYGNINKVETAIDGQLIAMVNQDTPQRVDIVDTNTWEAVGEFTGLTPVQKFCFSPKNSCIIIQHKHDANANHENCLVWRISDKHLMCKFTLRTSTTAGHWPPIRWSTRETFAFRLVTNELHVFDGDKLDLQHPRSKVRLEGATSYEPGPEVGSGNSLNVLMFMPEKKGKPAAVKVYDIANPQTILSQKSFYHASEVEAKWSTNGKGVLVVTHTDTDATGKSYYGSSCLYLLRTDGSFDGQLVSIDEGPVQDVAWSPKTNDFVLCHGKMPATLQLCEGSKGNKKVSYGLARKNTVRWSPFGRCFAVGGFGNLAGDLEFWDVNQEKPIGSTSTPFAVVCEFAPDGHHLLAATTSPRLRVDNGVRIFLYNGQMLSKMDIEDLYVAEWLSVPQGTYRSIPFDPDVIDAGRKLSSQAAAPSGKSFDKAGAKPGIYRAPGSTGATTAALRAARGTDVASQGTKVSKSSSVPGLPPGYAPPEAPKKKNRRRKKAGAGKDAEEDNENDDENDDKTGDNVSGTSSLNSNSSDTTNASAGNTEETEEERDKKKVRNLKKKLGEIKKLKEKVSGGDAELNETQKIKLASEAAVEGELNELMKRLKM